MPMRYFRSSLVIALLLGAMPMTWANAPIRNQTFNFKTPSFDGAAPKHKLVIHRDLNATTGKLILPAKLFSAAKGPEAANAHALSLATALFGVALTGSLIAGGLWFARWPHARHMLAVMIPLLGCTVIAAVVQAEPARLEAARPILETGKVRLSRSVTVTEIQLFLPKKPLLPADR